jgi:hypothetical protein
MATHTTVASMLKESLDEYLEAAKYCCEYKKTDLKWGVFNGQGCLGYPAGVLLFAIIDGIGSYFLKNKTIKIMIDQKQDYISGDGAQYFKILNSKYFGLQLSGKFIKELYKKYRCFLTHNASLGINARMIPSNDNYIIEKNECTNASDLCFYDNAVKITQIIKDQPFFTNEIDGKLVYIISLKELYELCKTAVEKFKEDIDSIVPYSVQTKKITNEY